MPRLAAMTQHKEEILAAIRRRHRPDTLLGIANTMHGHLGRVQLDLEEMVKEGTVTRHTLTSTDEYGTTFSYYAYTAS